MFSIIYQSQYARSSVNLFFNVLISEQFNYNISLHNKVFNMLILHFYR